MNIKWRTDPESILDQFEIERVNEVAKMFRFDDCLAIDSYAMSVDGPILTSVFLPSDLHITEVHIDSKDLNCDISPMKSACNLRVTKSETRPPIPNNNDLASTEDESVSLQPIKFIEVKLVHYNNLASNMGFFGDNADEWLSYVLDAHLSKKIWI